MCRGQKRNVKGLPTCHRRSYTFYRFTVYQSSERHPYVFGLVTHSITFLLDSTLRQKKFEY